MKNLFKIRKLPFLLISILTLFTFIACSSDAADEVNEIEEIQIIEKSTPYSNDMESELSSIAEIATEDGRFNTLVTALVEADLAETLSGEGTFTVFAPTDDAFAALPEGTLEGLLADKEALSGVLLYHVLGSVVMAESVVEVSEATTLQGSDIAVEVVDGKVFVNDSQVIITDLEASNGVIHVIDKVLIPGDESELSSIAEIATEDGRFNTLVTALVEADLAETLSGEGTFTVFAPTDDAFAALPEGTLEGLLADKEALSGVLLYHVLGSVVMAESVVEVSEATTLQGSDIAVEVVDGKVFVNDSQVIITDLEASNGVIHVIDKVLIPGDESELSSIAEIATEDGRFNTLVTALVEADLAETLSGEGTFTVFAPTDDAFAALPEGTLEGLLADKEALSGVLLYHVLGSVVMAESVVEVSEATTLQGSDIAVEVVDGKVFVNDSQVIITDLEASNGVIHVIDKVLIP